MMNFVEEDLLRASLFHGKEEASFCARLYLLIRRSTETVTYLSVLHCLNRPGFHCGSIPRRLTTSTRLAAPTQASGVRVRTATRNYGGSVRALSCMGQGVATVRTSKVAR